MIRHTIGSFSVFVAVFSATLAAQPNCSIQTVAGTWAASSTGTFYVTIPGSQDVIAVPGAALGVVSIDSGGGFWTLLTGWGYQGTVGTWKKPAIGTVSVNPDCTGQVNASHPAGWNMKEQILVSDNGDEIWTFAPHGMQGQPAVWQCRWRRIAPVPLAMLPGNCAASLLHGTWVGSYSGVLLKSPPVAAAISFSGVIDYQGRLSGKFTDSFGGAVGSGDYAGSIAEVNADCTGTWNWKFTSTGGSGLSGAGVEKFVILDDGNEIWTLSLQGPAGAQVGLGKFRRISPIPAN